MKQLIGFHTIFPCLYHNIQFLTYLFWSGKLVSKQIALTDLIKTFLNGSVKAVNLLVTFSNISQTLCVPISNKLIRKYAVIRFTINHIGHRWPFVGFVVIYLYSIYFFRRYLNPPEASTSGLLNSQKIQFFLRSQCKLLEIFFVVYLLFLFFYYW